MSRPAPASRITRAGEAPRSSARGPRHARGIPPAPVLLTGFEPFGRWPFNPSGEVAGALDGTLIGAHRVVGRVLPVSYRSVDAALAELFAAPSPWAAVLMLGLAGTTPELRFERVALNLDDAPAADNHGEIRIGTPIVPDGPVGYFTTLPLERLMARLTAGGYPTITSRDAGGFLCNHVFFTVCHRLAAEGSAGRAGRMSGRGTPSGSARRPAIPAGFLHVPLTAGPARAPEDLADAAPIRAAALAMGSEGRSAAPPSTAWLLAAVTLVLQTLLDQDSGDRGGGAGQRARIDSTRGAASSNAY